MYTQIWDRKTLTEITTLRGHMEAVKAVRFDKDVIVSASLDRVVRVWSRRTHGLLAILCGHTDEVLMGERIVEVPFCSGRAVDSVDSGSHSVRGKAESTGKRMIMSVVLARG